MFKVSVAHNCQWFSDIQSSVYDIFLGKKELGNSLNALQNRAYPPQSSKSNALTVSLKENFAKH